MVLYVFFPRLFSLLDGETNERKGEKEVKRESGIVGGALGVKQIEVMNINFTKANCFSLCFLHCRLSYYAGFYFMLHGL